MKKEIILIIVIVGIIIGIGVYSLARTMAPSFISPKGESSDESNIQVTSPAADTVIHSPVIVRGNARVFENALSARIQNQNGEEIASVHVMAAAPDIGQFGPFTATIPFPNPQGEQGSIEVFSNSAKDGTEINKVIIPIRFAQ